MAAERRKQIEDALGSLGSLKGAGASEQARIIDEVVALLASLDGELASLSARLRWHASAPFRSKKDGAPEGKLAFELLRRLTGRLGQEAALGDVAPGGDDAPAGDPAASGEDDPRGGSGARHPRVRRGRVHFQSPRC